MRLSPMFPTLVGDVVLPDAAALNGELAAWLRDRARTEEDRSPRTTVNVGWQSGLDLLDDPFPPLQALRSFFHAQVAEYLEQAGRCHHAADAPTRFTFDTVGWAVILRPGGFQHEHVHTRTQLVGVYWVEVPEALADRGALDLGDPRAGRVYGRSAWELDRVSLLPTAGRLVLFPSFVPHRVHQVAGGDRISINFDVTVHAIA